MKKKLKKSLFIVERTSMTSLISRDTDLEAIVHMH